MLINKIHFSNRISTLICLYWFASNSAAASTAFALDVGMGYDSNPNLLSESKEGSAIWSVHPQLYFTSENNHRRQWFLYGGYELSGAELASQNIDMPNTHGDPLTIKTPNTRLTWTSFGLSYLGFRNHALAVNTTVLQYKDSSNGEFDYVSAIISPEWRINLNKASRINVNYHMQQLNYDNRLLSSSSTIRQIEKTVGASVGLWHRWPGNFASKFSVALYDIDSNEGIENKQITSGSLQLWYVLNHKYKLTSAIDYSDMVTSFIVNANNDKQDDKITSVSISFDYQYNNNLSITYSNIYDQTDSNLNEADFSRTVSMFKTSLIY
ncbi:MAG: hypothetical protein ACE5EH_04785 [Gammaproteobacteria bacterium]